MRLHPIPNTQVWLQGREYIEAAEILLDYNRLQPAVILASLSVEIFLKSFLAKRTEKGRSTTAYGHSLTDLFRDIASHDANELLLCSMELEPATKLEQQLLKFDRIFIEARYRYEPDAPYSIGSDIVYFARHICETVFLLGKRRGV